MPRAVAHRPQPYNDRPSADSLATLRASLKRLFGSGPARAEVVPRESSAWLRPPRFGIAEVISSAAGSLVIELRDGRVYVGEVRRVTARTVVITLWGCGGARMSIERGDIVGAEAPRAHSWAAERRARERQRRGEPAHVWPAKTLKDES